MEIIPAIDLIGGKCVRLTKGDYATKKVYNEDPLEVALSFQDAGIKRLHLVDLDGAKAKQVVNYKVLEKICSKTTLKVDFGGGVQSTEDLDKVLDHGAKQITGGSIAVKDKELFLSWIDKYGPERIILGADVHGRSIAVAGWEEDSGLELMPFLKFYTEKGIIYTISTDVSKDGLLQGPATELYEEMQVNFQKLKIIASGGVSSIEDVDKLKAIGVYGVIIGKAIYENKISLKELERYVN